MDFCVVVGVFFGGYGVVFVVDLVECDCDVEGGVCCCVFEE